MCLAGDLDKNQEFGQPVGHFAILGLAYTTVIANLFFASFTTTASKSRVNFMKLLRVPCEEYVWGEDALMVWSGTSTGCSRGGRALWT
jgi:hypothetical protein